MDRLTRVVIGGVDHHAAPGTALTAKLVEVAAMLPTPHAYAATSTALAGMALLGSVLAVAHVRSARTAAPARQ